MAMSLYLGSCEYLFVQEIFVSSEQPQNVSVTTKVDWGGWWVWMAVVTLDKWRGIVHVV